MKIYNIEYTEKQTAWFGVEANNEEEALERFAKWNTCTDNIYEAIMNSNFIETDYRINDKIIINGDDILTDEEYHKLLEDFNL